MVFARLMPFLDTTKTHFARFTGVFGHDQNDFCPFLGCF
jgi:hypothetical protein